KRRWSGTLGKIDNCQVSVSVHAVGERGTAAARLGALPARGVVRRPAAAAQSEDSGRAVGTTATVHRSVTWTRNPKPDQSGCMRLRRVVAHLGPRAEIERRRTPCVLDVVTVVAVVTSSIVASLDVPYLRDSRGALG